MDSISRYLLAAQRKAERLFEEVIGGGIIQAGRLESELSAEIHSPAQSRFGLRRHWHKRIARSGPNTVLTHHDDATDRRITDDDIVYLDFGPVFDEWEADFGRTYVLGADAAKLRLIGGIAAAFQRGKDLPSNTGFDRGGVVRLRRQSCCTRRLGIRGAHRWPSNRSLSARKFIKRWAALLHPPWQ